MQIQIMSVFLETMQRFPARLLIKYVKLIFIQFIQVEHMFHVEMCEYLQDMIFMWNIYMEDKRYGRYMLEYMH